MKPGLEINDLQVRVGDFLLKVESLSVNPGEILAVMGASGSGKSTLLKAVAGFVPLEQGEIYNAGRSLKGVYPEERRTALLFQSPSLFSHMTVAENIGFGLRVQKVPKAERSNRVSDWISRMGLGGLQDRMPEALSGGQAQRVALARALITGFEVLLLDEPFSALDAPLRKELRECLAQEVRKTQVAVVLVTHDEEDAKILSHRFCILDKGRFLQYAIEEK